MGLGLIFDTETTGLWQKKHPNPHPEQPRLAQLAAILLDLESRQEVMRLDVIIYRPEGIPEAASNVHGTTTAISQAIGVNENAALDIFCDMLAAANVVAAHNIEYDVNVINNAARILSGDATLDVFEGKLKVCTMLATVPLAKMPNKYGHGGYGWPKLEEAVRKLLDREPTGAHTAIGDVIDARDLLFYVEDVRRARAA